MRRNAGNFTYAFAILGRERREAMVALYAFCRAADDAVDEGGSREEKRAALEDVRARLYTAFAVDPLDLSRAASGPVLESEGPGGALPVPGWSEADLRLVFVALAAVARRFGLDRAHLEHVLDGCAMDLERERYETFADLSLYLDRVASAVGRATMQICGLDPARHAEYAAAGGQAVQLTNILRDVKEDFERGRVYIPQEDLRRFGVVVADLGADAPTSAFRDLMRFEVDRNRALYARARAALSDRDRRAILPLHAIVRIYSRLLDAIERRGYDVLGARVRVPGWRKALLGLGTWARAKLRLPMGR